MKLNLNKSFRDLDGNDIEKPMSKLLAQSLSMAPEGPPIKFYQMAVALHDKGEIYLDHEDFNLLRSFVETTKSMTALSRGQILIEMDNQKQNPTKAHLEEAGSA